MGTRIDLTIPEKTHLLFMSHKPDYVIHCAGYNGGIAFNLEKPADVFYSNTMMGLNIVKECQKHKVKKLVNIVTSCAYTDTGADYLEPSDFLKGQPHPTVACHGYAKRNSFLAAKFFRDQYDVESITVCPNTIYGENDRLDPGRTKVLTALIKKFVDAKKSNDPVVTCWGTGAPEREFIYVEDAAKLIIKAMENWYGEEILNLSSGQTKTIKDLSELVASIVGYQGSIEWDTTKADGQMKKSLNIDEMKKAFPDFAFTPLEDGIRKTADWYEKYAS
jgi:GDP-L-fucose synthase